MITRGLIIGGDVVFDDDGNQAGVDVIVSTSLDTVSIGTSVWLELDGQLGPRVQPVRPEERYLRELLAAIHGDGGNHASENGLAKSTEEAIARVIAWKSRLTDPAEAGGGE